MKKVALMVVAVAALMAPAAAQAGWTWDDRKAPAVVLQIADGGDGAAPWYCRQVDAFNIRLYSYGQLVYVGPGRC